MPALTTAQRQARRLALLNEAARAAGWTGWRKYETAVITGRATMNKNNVFSNPEYWMDLQDGEAAIVNADGDIIGAEQLTIALDGTGYVSVNGNGEPDGWFESSDGPYLMSRDDFNSLTAS